MKLILAFLVWGLMALVIGKGIVMASHGSYWLLAISVLTFVVMVGKIGCTSH